MIGLLVIAMIMGTVVICSMVLGLVGLVAAGKIPLPGTEGARLRRAQVELKITEYSALAEENRFRTAQAVANREIMNATTESKLEQIRDEGFHRALNKGE